MSGRHAAPGVDVDMVPAGPTRELLRSIIARGFDVAGIGRETGWSKHRLATALTGQATHVLHDLAIDVTALAGRLGIPTPGRHAPRRVTRLERLERQIHRCPGCSLWVMPADLMRTPHRCAW